MTDANALLFDLVDLTYAAAVDANGWPRLLDRFCDIAPGAQGSLLLLDRRAASCDFAITARWDQSFVQSYVDHYVQMNPWTNNLHATEPDHPFYGNELVRSDSLVRTEFYADWLRPQGLLDGPTVVVHNEDERRMVLSILCPSTVYESNAAQHLRLLEILTPHLRRAASIHRNVMEAALAQTASQATLDSVTVGVALVTVDGRVRVHNEALESMLRASDGLHLLRGRLTATEHWDARAMQGAIRWAASPTPDPMLRPGTVAVSRPSGRRHYAVMVAPFRPQGGIAAEPLALLLVNDPETNQADGLAWLARLWRLTPAEARVFEALIAGRRLADIAETLGVSQNTLKSQMKAILQKSDCLGQSELIRVALRASVGLNAGT